jgi:hypothetical protein
MKKEILIAGIYLNDQKNNIKEIIKQFSMSSEYNVTQYWASIGKNKVEKFLKDYTVLEIKERTPKFKILNQLIFKTNLDKYEFVLISDDDITVPNNFIDNYFGVINKYDFSLAQPARTHDSYIDHLIVEQLNGLTARKTRFVEIGPLFSIRKDLYKQMLPFDEKSGMGWGYDFVWPCIIEDLDKNMGIVDAFPVEHKMRKPVINYNYEIVTKKMNEYLKTKRHISHNQAFRILESYAA